MTMPIALPYAFDFYQLQTQDFTQIHPFFENLRKGRLSTTKCKKCGEIHWQPRILCPNCNHDEMEWVDLPSDGEIFAHTAMMIGAPIGMEMDLPFVIALVQLKGTKLKILTRIDEAKYEDLRIGTEVKLKIIELEDGRVWFRFVPKYH